MVSFNNIPNLSLNNPPLSSFCLNIFNFPGGNKQEIIYGAPFEHLRTTAAAAAAERQILRGEPVVAGVRLFHRVFHRRHVPRGASGILHQHKNRWANQIDKLIWMGGFGFLDCQCVGKETSGTENNRYAVLYE